MKVGISRTSAFIGQLGHFRSPWLFAQEAEKLGFDSLWAGEHLVIPSIKGEVHAYHNAGVPGMPSSIVRLAGVAAATSTIGIGTAVLLLTEHNPLVLAKQLATLDADSGGRLTVGIGLGWNRAEMEIMGGNFDRRVAQTVEALRVLKLLWSGEFVSFEGEFYRFPELKTIPTPVQRPHPTILFGMNSENAFRRVVEHASGWMPSIYKSNEIRGGGIDRIARGKELLVEACRECGRDPASVSITAIVADTPEDPLDRALIERYLSAGADRVNLLQSREADHVFNSEAEVRDWMQRMADRVFG